MMLSCPNQEIAVQSATAAQKEWQVGIEKDPKFFQIGMKLSNQS